MKFTIEKPTDDKDAIERLFSFMLKVGKLGMLADPMLFMKGWHSGQIRVFTARENDELVGAAVVLLIKDPVEQLKYHIVRSVSVGVNMDDFINDKLEIFK